MVIGSWGKRSHHCPRDVFSCFLLLVFGLLPILEFIPLSIIASNSRDCVGVGVSGLVCKLFELWVSLLAVLLLLVAFQITCFSWGLMQKVFSAIGGETIDTQVEKLCINHTGLSHKNSNRWNKIQTDRHIWHFNQSKHQLLKCTF